MKVTKSIESTLQFDNGLEVSGEGEIDCCAHNYLDFEQFEVGTEFPTLTAGEFVDAITLKDDGFILKDSQGTPKWAQARSEQNGYYSGVTVLNVSYDGKTISLGDLEGETTYD